MQFAIRTTWFFMAVVSLVVSGCAVTGASGSATDTSTTNPVSPVTTAATVNSTVTTQSGQPDVPPDDVTTTTGLPADDVTTTTSDLVTIPNLQGLTSAASIHKRLNEVGLRSQIDLIRIQLHEREDPDSLVAVQEPGAGVKVRRGSTVEVLLYAPLIIDTTGDARSGTWEHFDERDGLASDCVSAIDVARDGMV